LTEIPGSSDVFDRGFVTYSNSAKSDMLGVKGETLAAVGAVSEDVALEMAKGAIARSDAGLAVAVTGIAGPGGSEFKPEGLVWFGLSVRDGLTTAFKQEFGAIGRDQVRQRSVETALAALKRKLDAFST